MPHSRQLLFWAALLARFFAMFIGEAKPLGTFGTCGFDFAHAPAHDLYLTAGVATILQSD
jgi:uncharacterized RDD family membrane protein YckC